MSVYHAVARATVRAVWRRVGDGDHRAATDLAVPDIEFRFVGDG